MMKNEFCPICREKPIAESPLAKHPVGKFRTLEFGGRVPFRVDVRRTEGGAVHLPNPTDNHTNMKTHCRFHLQCYTVRRAC